MGTRSIAHSIPTSYSNYVALYATQNSNGVNIMNLAANISFECYLLFLLATISILSILAILKFAIPTLAHNFSWFNTIIATIPCLQNQTEVLEHSNSATRIV